MNPVDLVGAAIGKMPDCPELPETPRDGLCAITGLTGLCVSRKAVVPKSNTDSASFCAPESDLVSVNAYRCFKYRPERASSWIASIAEGFRKLDRQDVRDIIIGGKFPADPWCMYITTSYKKHGSLHCQVNSGARIVVRFEMLDVDCSDRAAMLAIWERLNDELRNGIGRSVMESLNPQMAYIADLSRWIKFEEWARPLYKSGLYQLMCYLLPSQQELKEEKSQPKAK